MSESTPALTRDGILASSPSIPSPLLEPLPDNQQLVSLMAAITGLPADEVRRRLYDEEQQPGSSVAGDMRRWNLPFHVWSEQLIAFYDQTDAFLYELVSWNRT